jgi:hypothetical protein
MTLLTEAISQANNAAHALAKAQAAGAPGGLLVQEQVRAALKKWASVKALENDPAFVGGSNRVALNNAVTHLTKLYALAAFMRIEFLPIWLPIFIQPLEIRALLAREIVS